MTDSNHGRWEGFGMNIYVWAVKFSRLQPTLKSVALSYCVEWGGARKVFFFLNFWYRITVPGSVWELGSFRTRNVVPSYLMKRHCPSFCSFCMLTTLLHKSFIPKLSSLYLTAFTTRKDAAVLSGPSGCPLLCHLEA